MNELPAEIIIEILVLIHDQYIKSFCSSCHHYNKMLHGIIKTKRYRNCGFPRLDGKCKIHNVPAHEIKLNDVDYDHWHQELQRCTDLYINSNKHQLVKGDIVTFNPEWWRAPHTAIYNGESFDETGYASDEGLLEDQGQVLIDDVPLTYWREFDDHIHFDYNLVKDQCIKNLAFKEFWYTVITLNDNSNIHNFTCKEYWYTTFTLNHQTYEMRIDAELFELYDKYEYIDGMDQLIPSPDGDGMIINRDAYEIIKTKRIMNNRDDIIEKVLNHPDIYFTHEDGDGEYSFTASVYLD